MKILFICTSLEPGKDGVGDYSRCLASELIRQGHIVSVLAINDKHILKEFIGSQDAGGIELPVLRLPSVWTVKDRINSAKQYINDFDPDWLSLQFVIFGYHPKGLPFGLGNQLSNLGRGRRRHIMFHEIWTGITKVSPLKHKIYGFLQRGIIKSIVIALKPSVITTSNGLYKMILDDSNITADILPLFSNIPLAKKNSSFLSEINELLQIDGKNNKEYKVIGIFGSLYPQAKLEEALISQLNLAAKRDSKLLFVSFGRISEDGIKEFNRLKELFSNKISFFQLGEQSPENVSQLFQIMDLGISCTPKEHIGKSGVYAAMRYHSLEVLIPGSDYIPEYDADIKKYNEDFLFNREPYKWGVNYIAKSFLSLINAYDTNSK